MKSNWKNSLINKAINRRENKSIESCSEDVIEARGKFYNGLAWIQKNGKYGYIDEANKEFVPCKYDFLGAFLYGRAAASRDGFYGYIDRETGKEVIPFIYQFAFGFKNNIAIVQLNNKYGVIDRDGNIVIPFEYDHIGWEHDDRMIVVKNGKYGIMTPRGDEILPCMCHYISDFNNGVAKFEMGVRKGFLDTMGRQIDGAKDIDLLDAMYIAMASDSTPLERKIAAFYINREDMVQLEKKKKLVINSNRFLEDYNSDID